MCLHQAGVRGHDTHAETVGAAFGRGNVALVNVCRCHRLAALIEHSGVGLRGRHCPLRRDTLRRAHVVDRLRPDERAR